VDGGEAEAARVRIKQPLLNMIRRRLVGHAAAEQKIVTDGPSNFTPPPPLPPAPAAAAAAAAALCRHTDQTLRRTLHTAQLIITVLMLYFTRQSNRPSTFQFYSRKPLPPSSLIATLTNYLYSPPPLLHFSISNPCNSYFYR
jgi:hypothetical protein